MKKHLYTVCVLLSACVSYLKASQAVTEEKNKVSLWSYCISTTDKSKDKKWRFVPYPERIQNDINDRLKKLTWDELKSFVKESNSSLPNCIKKLRPQLCVAIPYGKIKRPAANSMEALFGEEIVMDEKNHLYLYFHVPKRKIIGGYEYVREKEKYREVKLTLQSQDVVNKINCIDDTYFVQSIIPQVPTTKYEKNEAGDIAVRTNLKKRVNRATGKGRVCKKIKTQPTSNTTTFYKNMLEEKPMSSSASPYPIFTDAHIKQHSTITVTARFYDQDTREIITLFPLDVMDADKIMRKKLYWLFDAFENKFLKKTVTNPHSLEKVLLTDNTIEGLFSIETINASYPISQKKLVCQNLELPYRSFIDITGKTPLKEIKVFRNPFKPCVYLTLLCKDISHSLYYE